MEETAQQAKGGKAGFRGLIVWQLAKTLAVEVYETTKSFPRRELFGLTSQMRSAAVSVPANIAEGKGRMSPADFARFLRMAAGSLAEVETYFDIALALDYITAEQQQSLQARADEVGKTLYGLIAKLTSP